jgi:folate-binding protein YgfZ
MMHVFLNRPASFLKVEGDDAATFLQGQFTNDLRQAPGSAVYGLFLNQRGKVVADAQVLRLAEKAFLVISSFSPVDVIRQRLEEYIVADDVGLVDETMTVHGLALLGPGSGEKLQQVLGVVPLAGRFADSGGMRVFAGRRTSGENFEIVGPETDIHGLCERLRAMDCREADVAQAEFMRIAAGIPAVPRDIGMGDLPNEGNLEEMAICYTKGCYLGQEVMARLKNMGQIRRRLHVVRGAGNPPEERARLYQGEIKSGEIRSVASQGEEFVALAMLTLLNLDTAGGLSLAPNAPPTLSIAANG